MSIPTESLRSEPLATPANRDDAILELTRRLLAAIADNNWNTYQELCDPSLTAFEPEARGQLVEGMGFHRFYFQRGGLTAPYNSTMASPHVRWLSDDVVVVSYVRLVQSLDDDGKAATAAFEETRIWQCLEGRWQHVHFHRSANS